MSDRASADPTYILLNTKVFVIPAEAGIQRMYLHRPRNHWIPACAGMTMSKCGNHDKRVTWN